MAVLYFDYEGQNSELVQMQKGFAQMLISDLVRTNTVRIVERARLEEVIAELKLSRSNRFDASTAARVGRLLGARYLMLGSYLEFAGSLRVDARVVETETALIIGAATSKGTQSDIIGIEERLVSELEPVLGQLSERKSNTGRPVGRSTPTSKPKSMVSMTAVAAYGRALDAMDRSDRISARSELTAALQASPGFELAAVDLSRLAL